MSYLDAHNLSTNGEFRVRLAAALVAYVKTVMNELTTEPEHVARLLLATKVFNAPQMYADRIALAVAVELGAAGAAAPDAMLDAIVSAYWTKIAAAPQVP